MRLLLCIRGEDSHGHLKTGTVYTFLRDATCPCNAGYRAVCVVESFYRRPVRLRCRSCKRLYTFTHPPWGWKRFIPLNDPDAVVEGEIRGNKADLVILDDVKEKA